MPYFSCYQLTFLSVNLSCRRILRINRIGIRVPNSSPAWGEVAVRPEEGESAWEYIRPRRSRGTPSN